MYIKIYLFAIVLYPKRGNRKMVFDCLVKLIFKNNKNKLCSGFLTLLLYNIFKK